jgi:hypothetical protein
VIRRGGLAVWVLAAVVMGIAGQAGAAGNEDEARALFKQGVALFQKGDYPAALDRYRQAYARFPSPKILLNIGTTLKQLGKNAEAAATYQRYLRDPGADSARRAEVERALAEIEPRLARLRIEIAAPGVKVLVDGNVAGESPGTLLVKVDPGRHVIVARKAGADDIVEAVTVAAGDDRKIVMAVRSPPPPAAAKPAPAVKPPPPAPEPTPPPRESLEPEPEAEPEPAPMPTALGGGGDPDEPEVSAESAGVAARRRFGALLRTDVDGKLRGAVLAVGATVGLGRLFEVSAAGLIGQHPGAYLGTHLSWPDGRFRVLVTAGAPVYFIEGPRFAAHGALGVRWDVTPQVAVTLEGGAEYFFDVPENFDTLVIVPSVGLRWLVL